MTDLQSWWRLLMSLALCAAIWGLPAHEAAAAPSCTATMTNLSFGDVDLVSGGTPTATATMTYACTNDQNGARHVRLCLNIGDGSAAVASGGGHWNPRILRDTAATPNEMNVQFYQGATSTIWGSTTQPIPDAYDVVVSIPRRSGGVNGVATGSHSMRGEIATGQAALPNGTYTSSFAGNHTALRYTAPVNSVDSVPSTCSSANTDGGTFAFSVTANVVKSCLVSADPLDFGTVDGVASSTNIDSTTSIRVICSRPTAYDVRLLPSNGDTGGSSAMKGQTAGNTDTVPYRLYSNAGRTVAWGSLNSNDISGSGTGLTQTLTVYGRVPGLPNVQADDYKDTVTVNVVY